MNKIKLLVISIFFIAATSAFAGKLAVNYVSTEHVYITGGTADGLAVGTKLKVTRNKKVVAELEVVFAAKNSASCKIVKSGGTIGPGDAIVIVAEPKKPEAPKVAAKPQKPVDTVAATPKPVVAETKVVAAKPERRGPDASLHGSIATAYSYWNDRSDADLDYSQTAVRMSLSARRLLGSPLALHFRGRTRSDWRRNQLTTATASDDWINQIWELSLSYEDPASPVKFYGGRILPKRVSRIGYLDGILTEVRLSETFRGGMFGGFRPDLLYAENPQTLSIGGGYLTWVSRATDSLVIEQSIAGVGEYHANITSRESIALTGRLQQGNKWGINESFEFDVNRSWRKVRANSSLDLSSVYFSGWMRLNRAVRVTGTYDNRTNYWTLQTRSIADSIFDDHLYQGARFMMESSLPWHCRLSGSVGMRKRPDRDQPTWSYMGMFRASQFFISGLSFSSQMTAYKGSIEQGSMFSTSLTKTIGMASSVGVVYGGYQYDTESTLSTTKNNWIEVTAQTDVARHWFIASWIQDDFGDDMNGLRTQMELGYRF